MKTFTEKEIEERRRAEIRAECHVYNHGYVWLPNNVREVHHFNDKGLDQGKCEIMSPAPIVL